MEGVASETKFGKVCTQFEEKAAIHLSSYAGATFIGCSVRQGSYAHEEMPAVPSVAK